MEVIKKLREYAWLWQGVTFANVSLLSDNLNNIADAIQKEVDERFIELPVDADGGVIHLGDEMQHIEDSDEHGRVAIITYGKDSVDVYVDYDSAEIDYEPTELCHYREPTVEDVLREFADALGQCEGPCSGEPLIAKYAQKLRIAEECEGM